MSVLHRVFVAAALAGVVPWRASAQCDSCRIAILTIPAGTRALGLGGAYVSGDGPDAIFYNPAQVGANHGSMLAVDRVGGAALAQFATTGSVASFGVGASIRFLARGDAVAGDSASLRGGALVAGVALAKQVRGIWLGGAANFVTPDLGTNGGGATFDVGAAARKFGLLLGISARNLGSDLTVAGNREWLPTTVSAGAALPATSISTYFDLGASAELAWQRGGVLVPKGGVELTYEPVSGWTAGARVGVRRPVIVPGALRESAVTLGGSLGHSALSIDYAFQPGVAGGSAVHSLGIRVQ